MSEFQQRLVRVAEPHEVSGVEYVSLCEDCGKPAERCAVQDEHGRWRHHGFRHLDASLNLPAPRAEEVEGR